MKPNTDHDLGSAALRLVVENNDRFLFKIRENETGRTTNCVLGRQNLETLKRKIDLILEVSKSC